MLKRELQIARSRGLRHAMTDAERKLWKALRAIQTEGFRVRRQHPVGRFILDYYCASAKIALELDGESHEGKHDYDRWRTELLESKGIEVVRVPNTYTDEGNSDVIALWFRDLCLGRIAKLDTLSAGGEGL